jgi:hypothetical protein
MMEPYQYERLKSKLFTDDGQRMFLRVRDFVADALKKTGAVRMQEAMGAAGSGDSWTMLACVDRLVELGELREIPQANVPGQDRVFVRAY